VLGMQGAARYWSTAVLEHLAMVRLMTL